MDTWNEYTVLKFEHGFDFSFQAEYPFQSVDEWADALPNGKLIGSTDLNLCPKYMVNIHSIFHVSIIFLPYQRIKYRAIPILTLKIYPTLMTMPC